MVCILMHVIKIIQNSHNLPPFVPPPSHALTQVPQPCSMSDLCLGVGRRFWKKSCIFTVWLLCPRPSTRTPAPEVMKSTIWVDPSLVIITISDLCLRVEKKIFNSPESLSHCHGLASVVVRRPLTSSSQELLGQSLRNWYVSFVG